MGITIRRDQLASGIFRKSVAALIILLALSSCASRETRPVVAVPLSGEQVDIGPEESLFEIVCVDDTSLVARQYSDISRLCLYDLRSPGRPQEFLHVGRGPFEVHYCTVKSRNDTIYVVSHTPVGLKGVIKIPVNGCGDMTRWRYEDLSYVGIAMGGDFDVCRDGYVVLGDRYGQPNILTKITRGEAARPLSFWPQDEYEGEIIPKQSLYMNASKVFARGDRLLYACSEGRYVTILDCTSGTMKETPVYGEYPIYRQGADRLNPERSPESKRGVYAYATDSLIYVSPMDCMIKGGKYVPDNYKGYPPYYTDRIEVYDWNGKYVCTYVLDKPFCNFYVSPDNRSLYTLSIDKETLFSEVYRYLMP